MTKLEQILREGASTEYPKYIHITIPAPKGFGAWVRRAGSAEYEHLASGMTPIHLVVLRDWLNEVLEEAE